MWDFFLWCGVSIRGAGFFVLVVRVFYLWGWVFYSWGRVFLVGWFPIRRVGSLVVGLITIRGVGFPIRGVGSTRGPVF